jgi:hypothetical protein
MTEKDMQIDNLRVANKEITREMVYYRERAQ